MEERLIKAVASHPELYDINCSLYRDRNKKDLAWRKICEDIGQSEDICRRKWKSLRDTYNKERRVGKEKRSGSAAVSGRKWRFSAVMGFLDPFLTPRETSCNMERTLENILPEDPGQPEEAAGKSQSEVSDVERRTRSLRTQYGRVLYHPEKVSPGQQKKLREKLCFLRPYIVRRRGYSSLADNFVDNNEKDEEALKTEGSIDQEMGSSVSSQLDADGGGQDLDEPQSVDSAPSSAPLQCPQPRVTEVVSLSCPHHRDEDNQSDKTAPKHDVLNQFAEVMLADMQQVEDPVLLMRLRRDITDLVFKAVEEDMRRRCIRAPSSVMGNGTQTCCNPLQLYSNISWSQRLLRRRRKKGYRTESRSQRREENRRVSRSQLAPPVHQGQSAEGLSANGPQVTLQVFEIKKDGEPDLVKIEDEPLALD